MSSGPHRPGTALVVGLGRSGTAAAALLQHLGAGLRVYDKRPAEDIAPWVERFFGPTVPPEALDGVDTIVLSPGVDPRPVRALAAQYAPSARITGELQLGLEWLASLASAGLGPGPGPGPSLTLITGTNGKSTVTAMIAATLEASDREVFAGGNFGPPPCELALAVLKGAAQPDALVIEASSYQLETWTGSVPVDVAIHLNLTEDHLARYEDFSAYAAAKARVFLGLREGGLGLVDASIASEYRGSGPHTVVDGPEVGVETGDGHGHGELRALDLRLPVAGLRVTGRHNARNAAYAAAAARHLGVELDAIAAALTAFSGLPHRMQQLATHDGITFYNDSKATNVASALASLQGFGRPFVLLAGGEAKGDDFLPLLELVHREGRGVIAFGAAAPELERTAPAGLHVERAADMSDAVQRATAIAAPGDAIVLSPACASFDQYRNFEARGDDFAAAVDRLLAAATRP